MKWGRDKKRRDKKEVDNQSHLIEMRWVESDKKGHVSQGTEEPASISHCNGLFMNLSHQMALQVN